MSELAGEKIVLTEERTVICWDDSPACAKCGLVVGPGIENCPNDGTQLVSDEGGIDSAIREKYEFVERLASGGMSVVYKARHLLIHNIVAIKLLNSKLESDPGSLKRFQLEATAISRLKHPNIVGVIDFGMLSHGKAYLVMDYIEGQTLSQLIKDKAPLPASQAIPLAIQIADAVAHAHEHGILHRDLKPSNVIIEISGNAKLVDFGIAKICEENSDSPKLTQTGDVFGSPSYMSPEQCKGNVLDGRSDIYSLGCLFYEMLTGHPPFQGTNPLQIMYKHVDCEPGSISTVLPVFDPNLDAAVMKMLAKNPDDRYSSMEEVKLALEAVLTGAAANPKKLKRSRSNEAKRMRLLASLGLTAVSLAGCAYFGFFFNPMTQVRVPAELFTKHWSVRAAYDKNVFTDSVITASLTNTNHKNIDLGQTLVSNQGLSVLPTVRGLHSVSLLGTDITNQGLPTLLKIPDLEQLTLSETKITDDGAKVLANHPSLTLLDLRQCPVTDGVFRVLGSIPKLNHFSLSGTKVTGSGLGDLAGSKNLHDFSLRATALSDEGLRSLPVLSSMRDLKVSENPLTDASVPFIMKGCPNVELVDIHGTQITGTGLLQLAHAPRIKVIAAYDCKNITQADVAAVKKQFPRCRVVTQAIDAEH